MTAVAVAAAVADKGGAGRVELWPRRRPAARLNRLALGLGLYGVSEALMLAPAVGEIGRASCRERV